jgi:hypothetical protein
VYLYARVVVSCACYGKLDKKLDVFDHNQYLPVYRAVEFEVIIEAVMTANA